jgi:hypothetical protein
MEITGQIVTIIDKKGGVAKSSGKPWVLQEYVIETKDEYPKKVCFEVFGEERISNFNIREGDLLTVYFDIDAHEYNGRWYNSIRAWKVERKTLPLSPNSMIPDAKDSTKDPLDLPWEVKETDDFPF